MPYSTLAEAQAYFDDKLHETAWSQSSAEDRRRARIQAQQIIDRLRYKGYKHTVWQAFEDDTDLLLEFQQGCATALATVRTAEAAQTDEFPRGADTVTPDDIKTAEHEITYALLDGVDPDFELENLSVNNMGIGNVRASFIRSQEPQEHWINGVPSAIAWRYLKPFMRDDNQIRLVRTS